MNDMENTIYQKVGKRYKRLGVLFEGWPSNGIWLVLDGSQSQIIKMGEIPKNPWPYIKLAKYQNEIADIITQDRLKYLSSFDTAKKIIKTLAGKE